MKNLFIIPILAIFASLLTAEDELFLLSPFTVDEAGDAGYLATNSISGTRIDIVPPVYITKPADFFAIQFQFINDSRLPEDRSKEIHSTILDFVSKVKSERYTLQRGQDIIDESNYQIDVIPYGGKTDTSFVQAILKVELEDQEVRDLTERMVEFVQSQKMVGRTYVLINSAGLSIKNPQSYRHEILAEIAKDIETIKSLFTGELQMSIDGLDNGVAVKQSSDRNVDLYIPYGFSFLNTTDQ